MSNALSDKQKDKLYQWLRAGNAGDLSRLMAARKATNDLDFVVTYTNMTSAEEVTGISLIKPPKAKEVDAELAARIYDLEREQKETVALIWQFAEFVRFPIPQKLIDKYMQDAIAELAIKPSQAKPTICHKHGPNEKT